GPTSCSRSTTMMKSGPACWPGSRSTLACAPKIYRSHGNCELQVAGLLIPGGSRAAGGAAAPPNTRGRPPRWRRWPPWSSAPDVERATDGHRASRLLHGLGTIVTTPCQHCSTCVTKRANRALLTASARLTDSPLGRGPAQPPTYRRGATMAKDVVAVHHADRRRDVMMPYAPPLLVRR